MSNFPAGQQKRGPFRPLSRRHLGGRPPSRPHTTAASGCPPIPVQAALPLAETPERRPPLPVSKWQRTGSARGPHCEGGPSVGKRHRGPGEGPQKGALPLPVPPIPPDSRRGKTGKAMRPSPRQTALCGEYLPRRRRPQRRREGPAAVPFRPPDPTRLPFRGTAPKRSRSAPPEHCRKRPPSTACRPHPATNSSPRQISAPYARTPRRRAGAPPPKALFAFLGKSPPHPTRLISPEHCRKRPPSTARRPLPAANSSPRQISAPSAGTPRRRAEEPPPKSPLCLSRKISSASNTPHLSRSRRKRPLQQRAARSRRQTPARAR